MINIEVGALIANRYHVLGQLGTGGMGTVYRVMDRELDNEIVALKLLHPHLAQDEKVFARFRNEVLIARSLAHPNIIRIYDIGKAETGYSYISMEFVEGYSLAERLSRRKNIPGMPEEPLAFAEVLSIFYRIALGVGYAHERGVIHRDLKPANVMISRTGEVKLADFGMARILGTQTQITQSGQQLGTPDYMSPEQIRGESTDASCDIYALGIIAYELAASEKPFRADSAVALAFKHLNEEIPKLSALGKNIPRWYEAMTEKAARKDKNERFKSAYEFAEVILEHAPQVDDTGYRFGTSTVRVSSQKRTGDGGTTTTKPQAVTEDTPYELGLDHSQLQGDRWEFSSRGDSQSAATAAMVGTEQHHRWRFTATSSGVVLLFLVTVALALPRVSNGANEAVSSWLRSHSATSSSFWAKLLGVTLDSQPIAVASNDMGNVSVNSDVSPVSPTVAVENTTTERATQPVVEPSAEALVVASSEGTLRPELAPSLAPASEPTETTQKAEPTPEENPLSFQITLHRGESRTPTNTFPLDSLSSAHWEVSVGGAGPDSGKELVEKISINLFDPRSSKIVGKLEPKLLASREGKVVIGGTFSPLARADIAVGSYRLDMPHSGEVAATQGLSFYRAKVVATPARDTMNDQAGVRVVSIPENPATGQPTTSASLPSARSPIVNAGLSADSVTPSSMPIPLEPSLPEESVNLEQYSGSLVIDGDGGSRASRPMTLRLEQSGETIRGSAAIDGYGEFRIEGKLLARGYVELILQNEQHAVKLTATKRERQLRGRYYIDSEQKRGAWEATLLR